MPRMNGIVESSLFVEDLSRACDFYEGVLGLRKVVGSDSAGYLFEAATRQLLAVISEKKARISSRTPGGVVPPCLVEPGAALGAGHIAFAIDKGELESWRSHLEVNGVEVIGEVAWDPGGRSLYFRDPDGHLLELATPGVWEVC